MLEIGAFEAKNKRGSLLDRVQDGEEIITRHGRPAARPVPYAGAIDRAQANAAFERIRWRAKHLKSGPFHWEAIESDQDSRRP